MRVRSVVGLYQVDCIMGYCVEGYQVEKGIIQDMCWVKRIAIGLVKGIRTRAHCSGARTRARTCNRTLVANELSTCTNRAIIRCSYLQLFLKSCGKNLKSCGRKEGE